MKAISGIIGIFIFCIGVTVFQQYYISANTKKINLIIDDMESAGRKNDKNAVEEYMYNLKKEFKKSKPIFTLLTKHDEIDKIELALLRVELCEDKESYESMIEELTILKYYMKQFRDGEKPNLSNIL